MFVPTRSSRLKSEFQNTCETVVYENKKNEKVTDILTGDTDNKPARHANKPKRQTFKKKKDDGLTMKKLRYDIIKFGTSGFSGAKKEESKIALAVSLGAMPPKKKYVNYKTILKQKDEEKKEKARLEKLERKKSGKKAKSKLNPKEKKLKNNANQLLDVYGKVQKIAKK